VLDRPSGRIWLPLTRNHGSNTVIQNKRSTGIGEREVLLYYSDDEGQTWSELQNITKEVKPADWTWYAVGPGCGIQFRTGRLVIPCNHRVAGKPDKNSIAHVIYSDDHGNSWKAGGSTSEKTNESQVVELASGDLLMNMRSHDDRNRRVTALSKDGGETWSEATFAEELIEPVCQGSIIRLAPDKEGKVRFAFSNPASTKREKMTVRLSEDGCVTWPLSKRLHEGSSGYSSLVEMPGNSIGCLFEKDKASRIVFVRFSVETMQR
jgi:sialidase-1